MREFTGYTFVITQGEEVLFDQHEGMYADKESLKAVRFFWLSDEHAEENIETRNYCWLPKSVIKDVQETDAGFFTAAIPTWVKAKVWRPSKQYA